MVEPTLALAESTSARAKTRPSCARADPPPPPPPPPSLRTLRFRALVATTPIPDDVLAHSLLDILRLCTWALLEDERWRECGRVAARHARLVTPPPIRATAPRAPAAALAARPAGRGGARPGAGRPRLPRPDLTAHVDRLRALARALAARPDPARIDALPLADLDLLACWAAFTRGEPVLAARLAARVARAYGLRAAASKPAPLAAPALNKNNSAAALTAAPVTPRRGAAPTPRQEPAAPGPAVRIAGDRTVRASGRGLARRRGATRRSDRPPRRPVARAISAPASGGGLARYVGDDRRVNATPGGWGATSAYIAVSGRTTARRWRLAPFA